MSKFNGQIDVKEFFGKKIIYVSSAQQSGGLITYMWEKVIGDIYKTRKEVYSCLVLGIGGADVLKKISAFYPGALLTGVDIDQVMIDVSYEFFSLRKIKNTRIVIADAISWIKNVSIVHQYDLIIVDLYNGRDNPKKSRQKDFLMNLRKSTGTSGLILYNCHYYEDKKEEYYEFIKLCRKIFLSVKEVFIYPYNRILSLR